MRIIFLFVPYSDALHQANLETLSRRRQSITTKLFDSITCNSDHKLHELLPPRNNCESNLRRKRNFNVPLAKTKRLKNTFIYSNCNYFFSYVYIFLTFFLIFLLDFTIVTINLIQLLAAILIRINYPSIRPSVRPSIYSNSDIVGTFYDLVSFHCL